MKTKFFALMSVVCTVLAVAGIALGYFVFGPLGVSVRANAANGDIFEEQPVQIPAYVNHDTPAPIEPAHGYILTSHNGVVVVHHFGDKTGIKETTRIPVNALPPEDQARLAEGIRIYTEEALVRILEDYGS